MFFLYQLFSNEFYVTLETFYSKSASESEYSHLKIWRRDLKVETERRYVEIQMHTVDDRDPHLWLDSTGPAGSCHHCAHTDHTGTDDAQPDHASTDHAQHGQKCRSFSGNFRRGGHLWRQAANPVLYATDQPGERCGAGKRQGGQRHHRHGYHWNRNLSRRCRYRDGRHSGQRRHDDRDGQHRHW